jgi:hypothetical protein
VFWFSVQISMWNISCVGIIIIIICIYVILLCIVYYYYYYLHICYITVYIIISIIIYVILLYYIYIRLHVNHMFYFLDRFSKDPQISNIMKIRGVGAELFHVDRQTDLTKLIVTFLSFPNAPEVLINSFRDTMSVNIQS